jgi:hydroxymethylpyrimidine pyrophosphatase-like HAD family hydrolase
MIDLLVTDLDQTLIYSDQENLGPDRVQVEMKDSRGLSFMSFRSVCLLKQLIKHLCIIPLTTRSREQYERIIFPNGWTPSYALVANGAILFRDGRLDEDWYKETISQIMPSEEELWRGEELLKRDPDLTFEIRKVDGVFLFTKSANPEATKSRLREQLDAELIHIQSQKNKVYILPKIMHKGAALERLRTAIPCRKIYCAGDSEFDLPMLEVADFSFAPEDLLRDTSFIHGSTMPMPRGILFSDAFLSQLQKSIVR